MPNFLRKVFPPVHRHSKRMWWQWRQWNDPFAELHPSEHGIVRRISAEAVNRNGLVLDFADAGFSTWRVA
jgi:hypothetical protein